MKVFIDTSGFLSLLDKDDGRHLASKKTWTDLLSTNSTLITTNYVLVETSALVQNRLGLAAARVFEEDVVPVLRVEWLGKAEHEAAMAALLSFSRRKLSLVDCTSFATMRRLGTTTAFTLDRHFKEQGFSCIPS